jgi:hypothetical protein
MKTRDLPLPEGVADSLPDVQPVSEEIDDEGD